MGCLLSSVTLDTPLLLFLLLWSGLGSHRLCCFLGHTLWCSGLSYRLGPLHGVGDITNPSLAPSLQLLIHPCGPLGQLWPCRATPWAEGQVCMARLSLGSWIRGCREGRGWAVPLYTDLSLP